MPQDLSTIEIFISYSHESDEHRQDVADFSMWLQTIGFTVVSDAIVETVPLEKWPRWMANSVRRSAAVIMICTATYGKRFKGELNESSGKGVAFEAKHIMIRLYKELNQRDSIIPVVFKASDTLHIPFSFQDTTAYNLASPGSHAKLAQRLRDLAMSLRNEDPPPQEPRDSRLRKAAEDLEVAYLELKILTRQGKDTSLVKNRILQLRRTLRQGRQFHAGDVLGDGRYSLLCQIGDGAFGTVFKAYDEQEREVVAVKILHSRHLEDSTYRERFFRGARKMRSLKHEGIVRVLDLPAEDADPLFFVMELIDGGDLSDWMRRQKPSCQMALSMIKKVGEALSFAHQKGAVHRDVKPANILLDRGREPKLTDFDLVRAVDTTGGTRTGAMGTLVYAAPEAMSYAQEAGEPADVYGLGMTALALVYGGDLPITVLRDRARFIDDLDLPRDVKMTLMRATAWDIEERFSTVQGFCSALRESDPGPEHNGDRDVGRVLKAIERAFRSKGRETLALLARERRATSSGEALFHIRNALVDTAVKAEDHHQRSIVDLTDTELDRFFDHLNRPPRLDTEFLELHDGWRSYFCAVEVDGKAFKIARAPVSIELYRRFDPEFPVAGDLAKDHPVVNITWLEATMFCLWLAQENPGLRLPSRKEWLLTATGGKKESFEMPRVEIHGIQPVGQGSRGPFGVRDMLGNVNEWCCHDLGRSSRGFPAPVVGGPAVRTKEELFKQRLAATRTRSPRLGFRCLIPGDPL